MVKLSQTVADSTNIFTTREPIRCSPRACFLLEHGKRARLPADGKGCVDFGDVGGGKVEIGRLAFSAACSTVAAFGIMNTGGRLARNRSAT